MFLYEYISGESIGLNVIDRVNLRLKFLHKKGRSFTPSLGRILYNALIQLLFDYACTACFSIFQAN